jgi:hypothetical protein
MSTPDQPSQPLTRRRLRELKLTGQTPVITGEEPTQAAGGAEQPPAPVSEPAPTPPPEPAPVPETPATEAANAPEAAKAEEAAALAAASAESTAPPVDAAFPRPLTRRAVRQLRTNEVPVVGEHDEATEPHEANVAAIETVVVGENEASVVYEVVEVPFAQPDAPAPDADRDGAAEQTPVAELVYDEPHEPAPGGEAARADEQFADRPVDTVYVAEDAPSAEESVAPQRPTVAPAFGSTVLRAPAESGSAPSSFEEILSHSTDSSGSATAASTLILATDPGAMPLSAPIDATGEVLITSTHALPDGFGSRGHAAGTTDGKDVDVVLIDGELPLASSPTPIAASDAVSTSKSPAEVIRPPAPEKTHRLTLLLGITAGALGIALIGVVVAAFTTGVLG